MHTLGRIIDECFFNASLITEVFITEKMFDEYCEKHGLHPGGFLYNGWSSDAAYISARRNRKFYTFNATYKQAMYGLHIWSDHIDAIHMKLDQLTREKNGVLICNEADTLLDRIYGKTEDQTPEGS